VDDVNQIRTYNVVSLNEGVVNMTYDVGWCLIFRREYEV
jgi:hypothetical protein